MKAARLVAVCGALAALLATSACTGKDAVDQSGGNYRFVSGTSKGKVIAVADRKKAGNFTGNLLDGGTLALSQDAGKVVVINFWATWCGPCTVETPQFDGVYRATKAQGVDFIGVDTKEASKDAPRAFVTDNKISFPIIYDEQAKAAVALGRLPALALPFTVLVDKQQRIAAVYLGAVTAKDLQPVLDQLIAET